MKAKVFLSMCILMFSTLAQGASITLSTGAERTLAVETGPVEVESDRASDIYERDASWSEEQVRLLSTDIRQKLQIEDFLLWPLTLPEGLPDHFEIVVEHEGVPRILRLQRHSLRVPRFRVRIQQTDSKIIEVATPAPRTYRGFIEGQPDSLVAASLLPTGLTASIIEDDKSIWHIQPLPEWNMGTPDKMHLTYRQEDVIAGDWMCGSDALVHPNDFYNLMTHEMSADITAQQANCIKVCEIAFDADVEFYQANGSSVPNTIADIENIMNAVDLIYARDTLITYTITDVLVRTAEPDPYSGTAAGDVLGEFRSEWNSNQAHIQRDTAHMMTGKNLDGNIIGVAWVTVICNTSWAYGLSQSRYTSNFAHRVALTAHEVGHNWSAGHCNADSDCSIMCSGLGGCSGNVSGFGSTAIEEILSYRSSRTCLQDGAGYGTPVPPKANLDKIVLMNTGTAIIDVLANDYDGNCDILVIDDFQAVSSLGGTVIRSIGTGPDGRDELLYTSPSYDFGEDSFTYTAGDGTGLQATGTVKIIIKLPNTLQGHWNLDETTGTTANDSSGNGYHGTLEGGFTFDTASVLGQFGNALNFNGVDNYIETDKTAWDLGLSGNAARTVTAWVYTLTFNDAGIYEMGQQSPGRDFSLRTRSSDNQWRVQYWGTDPATGDIDFTYTSKNRWVHFAHAHDGTRTKIYADGQLEVDVSRTLNTADTKTFKIGWWDDTSFDGIIDDVRVYNYALDISGVLAVMSGGRAENPRPFDSAVDVPQRAILNWVSGASALYHDVYLGTSWDAVANATPNSPEYKGRQSETFYVPFMETNTGYFWRIDEVTPGAAVVINGNVWSFTTGRNAGTITREVWTGISGDFVSNLTDHPLYPDSPNIREEITGFEGPVDWSDNYGTRIHGFLTPSNTGSYTFWIASDDYSELWLSSDANEANQIKIAEVTGWTDPRQWDRYPQQQSSPVMLTAGQTYYIKALHKEGTGGDNIAVAWQGPDVPQQVISRLYISPYDTDFPTPNPVTWAKPPYPTSSTSISMEATAALDRSGVKYYFACTSGNGHDSGWQDSPTYIDTNLEPDTIYTYIVTARDKSHNHNTTLSSQSYSARTVLSGDFESDGDVDFYDYARFASYWLDADTLVKGLVAHWKLDGDANDPVGGNHGTVYGNPVWTAGQLDGALNFDGDGDYIDCGNDSSLNLTNNFSIATWFNPDDAGPVVLICICKGNVPAYQSGGAYTILCVPSNRTLSFYVRNSSNTDFEYATTTITLNKWTHVVGTFSDGNIIVYKNGSFAADGDLGTSTIHSNNESLGIGAESDGGMPFKGRIDDVCIYDRVLSEAEAEELTELWIPEPYNADLDDDNDVDRQDLAILAENWLGTVEQPPVPLPGQASNPFPADGATNVSTTEDNLNWTAGTGATSYDVYFGTDSPPPFIRNQTATTFDPPGTMIIGTTHYWRVDAVNAAGTTTGTVWSFTTFGPPP
jgi:hypothetical protein